MDCLADASGSILGTVDTEATSHPCSGGCEGACLARGPLCLRSLRLFEVCQRMSGLSSDINRDGLCCCFGVGDLGPNEGGRFRNGESTSPC